MSQNEELLQRELLELLEAKAASIRYNKINSMFLSEGPYRRELYPKHVEFLAAGKNHSQRAFIAANRTGKTVSGAVEMTYHLTGNYPDWWEGRRFLNAVHAWAAGVSNQSTKEVMQYELLGDLGDIGSGMIPRDKILKITKKPGVADAVETVFVQHTSGDVSQLTFKSYEQGRDSFQGTKKQVIWLDEEPKDRSIFTECLTRTMDKLTPGIIYCTFTPLFGVSDIVMSFLPDGRFPNNGINLEHPYRFVTQVSWDEVPHLSDEQKKEILSTYSTHERLARSKGIPSLGSGAIYPIHLEDEIFIKPFKIPEWWPRAYGLDVGWNVTAAVWGARDPDTGQIYIYSEHYRGLELPVIHALAIKGRGDYITGAIDPASGGVSQVDGKALFNLYEEAGLILEFADNSVNAGILKVRQMFESGQLKIFNTCEEILTEFRSYCRDEHGKVVKKKDHAMDALRYLIMTGLDYMSSPADADYSEKATKPDSTGRDELTGY